MSVPRDQAFSNVRGQKRVITERLVTHSMLVTGGSPGSVLTNTGSGEAQWSPSGQPLAVINAGVTPAGMAITPDGKFAYVANNNNYGVTTGNYISVLDLTTNMPLAPIPSVTFNQPYTVTLSTDGSKAYVTNSAGSTITIIDTATNTVTGTITGFDGPSGMAINGTTAYVNNYGASGGVGSGNGTTVSVVNLLTLAIVATITTDQAPAALALSPDGTQLYVANYTTGLAGAGTLQVIATASNTVIQTISGFSGPFGIAVSPDGTRAYVSNFGSNNFDPFGTTVAVVNLTLGTIVATVTVGIQPSGIAVSPDGKHVYVSNYNTLYQVGSPTFSGLTSGQGTVNVIDTATNTLLPITIAVGQSPANIAVSPSGSVVLVSNFASGTVSVLQGF